VTLQSGRRSVGQPASLLKGLLIGLVRAHVGSLLNQRASPSSEHTTSTLIRPIHKTFSKLRDPIATQEGMTTFGFPAPVNQSYSNIYAGELLKTSGHDS
jgi:hypothetical protein